MGRLRINGGIRGRHRKLDQEWFLKGLGGPSPGPFRTALHQPLGSRGLDVVQAVGILRRLVMKIWEIVDIMIRYTYIAFMRGTYEERMI